MWLSKRAFILSSLAPMVTLAACGFTPVHGPGGSAAGLRGNIGVAAPEDRYDYELVKRLEERLERAPNARFELGYAITVQEVGVGINPDQVIRRVQLRGAVTYSVTDLETDQVVNQGSASTFTAYSTEGSTVAASSAKRDAEQRLMQALADLISTRLYATAVDWMA